MNHNKMNYLVCMLAIVPLMTECMFLTLAKRSSFSPLFRRHSSNDVLCKGELCNRPICLRNRSVEKLIIEATRYPAFETNYAQKIADLSKIKTDVDSIPCCHDINLHLAAEYNRLEIAKVLLPKNKDFLHVYDVNGSKPIDLATTESMSKLLKSYGSPEKSTIPQIIKKFRVPCHWVSMNPIARACLDGDFLLFEKLLKRGNTTDKQKQELRIMALMLYWKACNNDIFSSDNDILSKKDNFLKIACCSETGSLQTCYE